MPYIAPRLAAALGLLLLAACQTAPSDGGGALPEPNYAGRTRFNLDVAALEIHDLYRPPLKAPNVEHEFPLPPAQAARRWALARLGAVGPRDRIVFTIREASVVETALPRAAGLRGAITDDQAERYDATLAVEAAILAGEVKVATVEARATRSVTVPESTTVNGRRRLWAEMTVAVMEELDAKLEEQIRRYFFNFLVL